MPDDIRIIDCVEVHDGFSARFDCISREYAYFFMRRSLDVQKMDEACKLLEGEHDFRNFCRHNVVQQDTYNRRIMHAGVYPADSLAIGDEDKPHKDQKWQPPVIRPKLEDGGQFDMFYVRIRANAFLWHQVDTVDPDTLYYDSPILYRRRP